jgi:hypothetical protein
VARGDADIARAGQASGRVHARAAARLRPEGAQRPAHQEPVRWQAVSSQQVMCMTPAEVRRILARAMSTDWR